MFMSDLCRTLTRPYSVYFVEASSYGDAKEQKGGSVSISSDIPTSKFHDSITKRPHKIVLIDELLDNGKTMEEMKQHLLKRLSATHTDNDILTTCLFSKKRDRIYPEADVTGIPDLPDLWLVGYGLDDRGTKRGWTELFAIPKVKIVETYAQDDVDMLLENLDDSGAVVKPIAFAGVELQHNHKQKYRVFGLDVAVGQISSKPGSKAIESGGVCLKSPTKAELQSTLASLSKIKGKFEQELRFAFIPDEIHLVPEDEIFSGNNAIYASMRCKLRRQINSDAQRLTVEGSGPVIM
jgi:hypoxanthine-guanine phosphoribosyltransferase